MLTANSEVAIRRGVAGSFTDFADGTRGLGAWQFFSTRRSRPVPSLPGVLAVQLLSIRDGSISFTVDDNPLSHPLMFLRSGEVFQVRIRRRGAGAGLPERLVTGIATINVLNAEGGARSFQFALQATALTEGVQAAEEAQDEEAGA